MNLKKKGIIFLAFLLLLSSYSFSIRTATYSFEDGCEVGDGTCTFDACLLENSVPCNWDRDNSPIFYIVSETEGYVLPNLCPANFSTGNFCFSSIRNPASPSNGTYTSDIELKSGTTLIFDVNNGGSDQGGCDATFTIQSAGTVLATWVDSNVGVFKDYEALVTADGNFIVRNVLAGSCGSSLKFWLDNVRYQITDDLINEVLFPIDIIPSNAEFTIRVRVTDSFDESTVTTATVQSSFNGSDFEEMVFSPVNDWWAFTYTSPLSAGDYNFAISSTNIGYNSDYDEGLILVRKKEFQYLTITPIQNIASFSYSSIDFIPIDELGIMIWRVDSNSATSETPTFKIFNGRTDGKQYFIYTSSDGVTYAFDDTLTFGSTNENPMQKIWSNVNRFYTYSFDDTLTGLETKYYKLTYKSPYKHFFSIANNSEWQEHLVPNVLDQNVITVDEYSISSFTNIRTILKAEVPDVFEDETEAFEFQFTAYSDVNETLLFAGITKNNSFDNDSVESITLTTTPKRFSITIDATDFDSQLLFKSANTTSAKIFITDYAIVSRGFFTKRLELFKSNGDPLDVFLLNNLSTRYIQEGRKFKINSGAYDREGTFNNLILEAYLDGTSANNLVYSSTFDLKTGREDETIKSFEELFNGVIDLNGTANNPDPPRTLILRARITDDNSTTVAIQSQQITFLQYPYFPNDLQFQFFPTEKRLGKHPSGLLTINMTDISVLEALDLRIYSDSNTVDAPNHRETIYKGTDFTCIGNICNLEITVDDYVFEDVNLTTITWFAILNTEYLNQDNRLTRIDRRIFVTPITFDRVRLHQVIERIDKTYRKNEEISLVLTLRDSEADSLKNKIDVYLTLQNCDSASGGNCVNQTIKYKPTGFVYDDLFNLNHYFFRHLYVLDDGSLLPDGNYIGFRAVITDKMGVITTKTGVLADRCQGGNYNPAFLDQYGNLPFGVGAIVNSFNDVLVEVLNACLDGSEQFGLVTTTDNSSEEIRLLIDEDHSVSSPSQELFACASPDQNNVFGKPLEQDLVCFVWYEVGEKPIDNFRIRITNSFSDVGIKGLDKQYIEFNLPYELIAINDIQLLENELKTSQNSTCCSTVGEFFYEGLRTMVIGQTHVYNLEGNLQTFLQGTTIITNIGAIDIDTNFNQAFSTTTISGAMFYKIKGIPILNVNDFSREFKFKDNFDLIDKSNFISVLRQNNLTLPRFKEAELEVFVSGFSNPIKLKDTGVLVIDEAPSNQTINRANLDINNSTGNYAVVPNILLIRLQNTMFFNNFSENVPLTLILRIPVLIKDSFFNEASRFWDELLDKPIETTTKLLQKNLLFIMIILILIIIGGVIFALYSRR